MYRPVKQSEKQKNSNDGTLKMGGNLFMAVLVVFLIFGFLSFQILAQEVHNEEIKVGVLANRGLDLAYQEWEPLILYLDDAIDGYLFTLVPLDFDQIIQAVAKREVEYIIANPSYYAELEYYGYASRIVTLEVPGEPQPQSEFGGVIFTRQDREDLNTLSDLKGTHFMAVDQNSLGGWHVAWREMKQAGIDPQKDFSQLSFAGTHDDVVFAVLEGNADAGTVRSTQLERMTREKLIAMDQIRIINSKTEEYPAYPYQLSTPLYPEWPFAAVAGSNTDLNKQITIALRIYAESQEGKGSVFYVELVLTKAPEENCQRHPEDLADRDSKIPTSKPARELVILLVEDNEVNQMLFKKILEMRNLPFDLAENGREAVEKAAQKEYDLIFMDIQMPVMDGYEATRQIRAMDQGKEHQPKIFALTAYAMKGDRDKCMQAGMDGYLSKPLDVQELFALLR